MTKRLPTGWLARTAGLARMAGSAALSVVRDRPLDEAVARLRGELASMKGLVAKLGQMLSTLEAELPPGVAEALASLQDQTDPLPPAVIWNVVRRELGRSPEELFTAWSPAPVAAASIGQVHRARLPDGREVAVKVQFPGVELALTNDFRNLKAVKSALAPLMPSVNLDAVIAELEARTLAECDYRAEAAAQTAYREMIAAEPALHVPAIVPELSTGRVLVSEYVAGQRFAAFAAAASQGERDAAAVAILRGSFVTAFRHGCFNADPHPGNFLFTTDPDRGVRVTMLDFGCTKRMPPTVQSALAASVRATLADDADAWITACGPLTHAPAATRADWEAMWRLNRALCEPLLFNDGPRRIDAEMNQRNRRLIMDQLGLLRRFGAAPDFVMFFRLEVGLGGLMYKLGACVDWRALIEEALP